MAKKKWSEMTHRERVRNVWTVGIVMVLFFGAIIYFGSNPKAKSPVEQCMDDLRDLSNQTGQPAGSDSELRLACEANEQ